jgi:transcriptional regulator with XRE-family HTH domain
MDVKPQNMKNFGKKLRTLRQRHSYTLRQLGELLEIDHSFISQLEMGKRIPNAAMILKIADTFGVTADLLMRDEIELDEGTNG